MATQQTQDRGKPQSVALVPTDTLAQSRLPITERLAAELQVTEGEWRTLVDVLYPAARSPEAVSLVLSYCRRRGLDPFKRVCHIVPMYSTLLRRSVETVWPGIAELRTTAARTGAYAGNDLPIYGPVVEREFIDKYEDERDARNNKETKFTLKYPEFCEYTVYRNVQGDRVGFAARVFWTETYATASRTSEAPNAMWKKRPFGQLEKCTEAAALRRGFPEELGSEYAADEMQGRVIEHYAEEVMRGHVVQTKRPPAPPPPRAKAPAPAGPANPPADFPGDYPDSNIVDADYSELPGDDERGGGGFSETDTQFLNSLRERLNEAHDEREAEIIWKDLDVAGRFAKDPDKRSVAESIRDFRIAKLKGGAK